MDRESGRVYRQYDTTTILIVEGDDPKWRYRVIAEIEVNVLSFLDVAQNQRRYIVQEAISYRGRGWGARRYVHFRETILPLETPEWEAIRKGIAAYDALIANLGQYVELAEEEPAGGPAYFS